MKQHAITFAIVVVAVLAANYVQVHVIDKRK
jgi:hypothetical protein